MADLPARIQLSRAKGRCAGLAPRGRAAAGGPAVQMSLLDMMRAPAIIRPVDGSGHVVQGPVAEVLTLPHPRMAWPLARIELHPHDDGLWMWSASSAGGGYRVGVKWGKFAETRDDAAHYAARELLDRCAGYRASRHDVASIGITAAQLSQIEAWAQAIADDPGAHRGPAEHITAGERA